MKGGLLLLIVVGVLAAGCATTLEPAPGAATVAGVGKGAMAEQAGVRVTARAQAWRGYPPDLRGVVTPMLVTIDNGSDRALRLRYEQFALEASGRTFAAVPPFEISRSVAEPAGYGYDYGYGYAYGPGPVFRASPYLSPYYPWWPAFEGPFWYDPWYYDRYGPVFREIELPTGDMIQKALAEGVLEPGARASGFLYFQYVRDVNSAVFTVQLVEARTDQSLGTIRIPFVVD